MCLYMVGPPEDLLRFRLRQSLVPGWTCPCSKEDIVFASARGYCLHGGVVVVLIAHLERRPRSSSVLVDPLRRGFYTCPGAVATAATIGGVFGMRWLIRFGEGF